MTTAVVQRKNSDLLFKILFQNLPQVKVASNSENWKWYVVKHNYVT